MLRLLVLVSSLTLAPAAPAGTAQAPAGAGKQASTARTVLAIEGMTCGGCVAAVEAALRKTAGVAAFEVSLEKKEAGVTFDPGRTDPGKIAAAVSKTGFKATIKGRKSGSGNE